jgi:phenylalanyl-tRNA synthetase alpha chain
MYKLTKEGEKYLNEGLPEYQLARLLQRPRRIAEVRNRVDNFSIALQWALKKRWVKKEGDVLTPLQKNPISEERRYLEQVYLNKAVPEAALMLLERRNLIERVREDVVKQAEKYVGKTITNLRPELIKTGYWKKVTLKPYNVTATGKKLYAGKRHPYNKFLADVKRTLVGLGFTEMTGPLIETEFWNFDALFQPQNHPSREWTQTYTLKQPQFGNLPRREIVNKVKAAHENGWKTGSTGWGYRWDPRKAARLMPRAHTTACSARTLAGNPHIPGKYFIVSRNFRPDVIDATHGAEFNHCEGIVLDASLNFRHLLGLLKLFAVEFAGAEKIKFVPDYYPFTEPSVQLSAFHPTMGWVELAGAGIFREELTAPLGIDVPVIAWGLGIDRLAMLKLNITDIRELFSQNLKWLREMPAVS